MPRHSIKLHVLHHALGYFLFLLALKVNKQFSDLMVKSFHPALHSTFSPERQNKRCRSQDEVRFYLCCPGLYQLAFLPSGKYIWKPSKIVDNFILFQLSTSFGFNFQEHLTNLLGGNAVRTELGLSRPLVGLKIPYELE